MGQKREWQLLEKNGKAEFIADGYLAWHSSCKS